jgi:hypothetical protein
MTDWVYLFSQQDVLDLIIKYSESLYFLKGLKLSCKKLYHAVPSYPFCVRDWQYVCDCLDLDKYEMFKRCLKYHDKDRVYAKITNNLYNKVEMPVIISKCTFFDYKHLQVIMWDAARNECHASFMSASGIYESSFDIYRYHEALIYAIHLTVLYASPHMTVLILKYIPPEIAQHDVYNLIGLAVQNKRKCIQHFDVLLNISNTFNRELIRYILHLMYNKINDAALFDEYFFIILKHYTDHKSDILRIQANIKNKLLLY